MCASSKKQGANCAPASTTREGLSRFLVSNSSSKSSRRNSACGRELRSTVSANRTIWSRCPLRLSLFLQITVSSVSDILWTNSPRISPRPRGPRGHRGHGNLLKVRPTPNPFRTNLARTRNCFRTSILGTRRSVMHWRLVVLTDMGAYDEEEQSHRAACCISAYHRHDGGRRTEQRRKQRYRLRSRRKRGNTLDGC
jgi:hypothetical protein